MEYRYLARLASEHTLVLGSSSPRRVRLLHELNLPFQQMKPELDEAAVSNEQPYQYARRLAEAKALWVSARTDPAHIVMGFDTIVVLEGQILGKPNHAEDAFVILSALAGKKHTVCTAASLARAHETVCSGYELTDVYFNQVSEDQIRTYIATGEPMDKAGAYGYQGKGGFLVDTIEGNADTVIGLPRTLLNDLARRLLEGR